MDHGMVEQSIEIDLSEFMLRDEDRGGSFVNDSSYTQYFLEAVIYGEKDEDPDNPDDFEYQARIRYANDGGRWRYIADNGSLCTEDLMYLSDDDHQRLCQTMIYTCDSLK